MNVFVSMPHIHTHICSDIYICVGDRQTQNWWLLTAITE